MELEKLYDQLYDEAVQLFKKYNYCNVKDGICGRGQNGGTNFCCNGCEYLSNNGCTVKALWCKLSICDSAYRMPNEFYDTQYKLLKIAKSYNLLVYRGSKKDSLLNAKIYMQEM